MLGSWDMRTRVAQLREETLMEQLGVIMDELRGRHAFKVESWEVARKDGGVFCHFSYMPPRAEDLPRGQPETAIHTPEDLVPDPTSAASIFLPLFLEAARKHGGWPHWAGAWWASCIDQGFKTAGRTTDEAGHHLYRGDLRAPTPVNASKEPAAITLQGWQRIAGRGRVWIVRGRQWTEDLNRFPSSRLRVEFDGPDVSQEMLYRLFRPYGRLTEIVPPSPVPAGALRFAMLSFSRISTTVAANNCMHGFLSPTKTADYDLQRAAYAGGNESQQGSSSSDSGSKIPMSRLRLYYERPLKAHYVRTWMSDHPRIVLPVIAFLVATLSYTFFDPIRAFFIRSHVEGMFNLEQYSAVKFLRDNVWLPLSKVVGSRKAKHRRNVDDLGRASWRDRLEAERNVERWLSEFPSTFVVITGPPGSGKHDLVNRIIQDEKK
jgi:hypothetical protein